MDQQMKAMMDELAANAVPVIVPDEEFAAFVENWKNFMTSCVDGLEGDEDVSRQMVIENMKGQQIVIALAYDLPDDRMKDVEAMLMAKMITGHDARMAATMQPAWTIDHESAPKEALEEYIKSRGSLADNPYRREAVTGILCRGNPGELVCLIGLLKRENGKVVVEKWTNLVANNHEDGAAMAGRYAEAVDMGFKMARTLRALPADLAEMARRKVLETTGAVMVPIHEGDDPDAVVAKAKAAMGVSEPGPSPDELLDEVDRKVKARKEAEEAKQKPKAKTIEEFFS
jgi:hypothetical protein